jgi:pimeloyl-ACP methyl ester carboxylesterase
MWRNAKSNWATITFTVLSGIAILGMTAGYTYQRMATDRDLAETPPPGVMVDIGGYRLHLWCLGNGDPTVILDSGLGGDSFSWPSVQREVAKFSRVCTYDRAGMGYSDSGPTPRTSDQIAEELSRLIKRAGLGNSVMLVGASFGGFNTRLLASKHPEQVSGLVLVDASHEKQSERYALAGFPEPAVPWHLKFVVQSASIGFLRVRNETLGLMIESADASVRDFIRATAHRTSRYKTMYDELIHIDESAEQVNASRRKLDIPLVVLTGGLVDAVGSGREIHQELQRDQLALSSRACQVIAERSGHVIASQQPELVTEAIRAVRVAALQKENKPGC